MPTLFDEADRAVLPESILIEYKAFGNAAWDRGLLRPIPVGYDVPLDTGWYLAPTGDAGSRSQTPTGGALSAWSPTVMDDLVTCVRDLLEGCWFRGLDGDGERSSDASTGTDRTPFGTSLPPLVGNRP